MLVAKVTISVVDSVYIIKWKKHFSEMKGDVGMSCHENKREGEEDAYTETYS